MAQEHTDPRRRRRLRALCRQFLADDEGNRRVPRRFPLYRQLTEAASGPTSLVIGGSGPTGTYMIEGLLA